MRFHTARTIDQFPCFLGESIYGMLENKLVMAIYFMVNVATYGTLQIRCIREGFVIVLGGRQIASCGRTKKLPHNIRPNNGD